MKQIIVFLISLLAISCKKDMYQNIKFQTLNFPDSIELKANVLNDTIFTRFAWGLSCYKDYIILNANMDDHFLHLYDKNSGTRIKSFAKLGRGPQEVLAINNFHINENEGILTAFSQPEKNIYIFYLDSILQNKEHYMEKISLKHQSQMVFFEAYKCPSGFLLYGTRCEPYPQGARFTLFSKQGELLFAFDQYPIKPLKDSLNNRDEWGQLLLSRTLSPDGTKFAEATQIGYIIETLDIKTHIERSSLKGYFKPHYFQEKNKKIFTPKTQFGALYLSSSNKYLYVLSYNGSNTPNPIHDIQVFDWQGKPVKKYKTDYHLLNIYPDEENGKIYALAKTSAHELILISLKTSDNQNE